MKGCRARLEKCKTANKNKELKEARIDTKDTKTTAVEDDMKRREERHPAARERAQAAYIPFKRTAKERYQYEQRLKIHFNQDKHHPSNDYPGAITKGANLQRHRAQKITAKEIRRNAAAIPRADRKAQRANAELKVTEDQIRAAEEPK